MPLTSYPNGLTTAVLTKTSTGATIGQNSAAGDGDCDIKGTAYIAGSANITGNVIGQHILLTYTFSTVSTAQIIALPSPFTGQHIATYVTVGSVSAVLANYSVQIGSAGSVSVATVANTVTTSYLQESIATTTTNISTASGFQVTRSAQGTTGDTVIGLLLRRTA